MHVGNVVFYFINLKIDQYNLSKVVTGVGVCTFVDVNFYTMIIYIYS